MTLEILLATVLLAGVLAWFYRRDQRRHRAWRRGLLTCDNVPMEDCRCHFATDGFPYLEGSFAGRAATVQLIRDDATMRKLPSLWISATLRQALPAWPTVDVVARHRSSEFFTPALELPHRLPLPPHWPDELLIKSSEPIAPLSALESQVIEFFADPRAKEILVTPRGVRVRYQLAQARRAEYLVLRAGEFDEDAAEPELIRQLLARAHGIITQITRTKDRAHAH